jgi:C-terminal processing protease CtpA/Prc
VAKGSLAEKVGLSANDLLVSIAGIEVFNMTHDQVRVFNNFSCPDMSLPCHSIPR